MNEMHSRRTATRGVPPKGSKEDVAFRAESKICRIVEDVVGIM